MRATAVRLEPDDFPGWVEVVLNDAQGHLHRIVEKAPVLTQQDLSAAPLPRELWLDAVYQRMEGNEVIVRLAHGVTTTGGRNELPMTVGAVRWL